MYKFNHQIWPKRKKIKEKGTPVQQHGIQQRKDSIRPQSKNQLQGLSQQPTKIQKVFYALGTLSKYNHMKRNQESRGHQSNVMNLHHSNEISSSVGGGLRSQKAGNANEGDLRAQHPTNDMNLHSHEISTLVGEDTSDFLQDNISDHNEVPNAPDLPLHAGNENAGLPLHAGNKNAEKKKHRGKTMLKRVQTRTMEQRDIIIINNLHQPVGRAQEVYNDFTHFLGVYAEDALNLPLTYISWKHVPKAIKEDIWENVQKKFIIPEEAKKWVLNNVNNKWKQEKTRVKKLHYTKFSTYEERIANRPLNIPIDDFKELLRFWDSPEAQNRDKQDDIHTMGPKPLAILRHELKEKDPNKKPPSQADIYMNSRLRTVGRTYLTRNEDTQKNIEKMQELKSLNDESGEKDPNFDPYPMVMTKKEHSGTFTLSKLMNKDDKTPFIVPPVFLKDIAEKMRKSITEEVQQTIAKQMDQHFSTLLSKFQEANPGTNLVLPEFSTNEVDDASSSHDNLDGDHFEDN